MKLSYLSFSVILALLLLPIFITPYILKGLGINSNPSIMPVIPMTEQSLEKIGIYNVPILMYHSIDMFSKISISDKNKEAARNNRIPLSILIQQLDILKNNKYNTISFSTLKQLISTNTRIPEKSVILTFDDGWADNYQAFLELKKRNQVGSFAIVSDFVDKPNRLSKDQLNQMIESGSEVINHSKSHSDLTKVSQKQLTQEIETSKITLEQMLGISINTIVYPTGAYNTAVINEVENSKYQFGLTTNPPNKEKRPNSLLELQRFRMQCESYKDPSTEKCVNLGGSFFKSLL